MTTNADVQLQAVRASRELVRDTMHTLDQLLTEALRPVGLRPLLGMPPMLLVDAIPSELAVGPAPMPEPPGMPAECRACHITGQPLNQLGACVDGEACTQRILAGPQAAQQ